MVKAGLDTQIFPDSSLYIVGLPIGNAADITLRALWALNLADVVAAEDTRETKKILERFSISVPTVSVREHNEVAQSHMIIERLQKGERVMLVTDAGTPAVSDAAGLEPGGFHFVGFVAPQSKARHETLQQLGAQKEAFVLYEAPHRVKDLLCDLAECLNPQRRVVVAREITKKFETFTAMTAQELSEWIKDYEPRGEYVILVDAAPSSETLELKEKDKKWVRALAQAMPSSKAAATAAKIIGCSREDVYQWLLSQKANG